jgi:hypothetical protein
MRRRESGEPLISGAGRLDFFDQAAYGRRLRRRLLGGKVHAIVVRVTVNDFEAAQKTLDEQVVPTISQAPGFVAGYWLRPSSGNDGLSVVVFESEDQAQAAAERVPQMVPAEVTFESVETREVVAHA